MLILCDSSVDDLKDKLFFLILSCYKLLKSSCLLVEVSKYWQLHIDIEQERPAYKLAYGEMQCAVTLEMKYKRLRYSHSLARPPFCPPSWNLQSDLCHTFTTDVRCHCPQFSEKRSLYIKKWLRYSKL